MSSCLTIIIVSVPFTRPPISYGSLPNSFDDDLLQAGPKVGWFISCLYFRTCSPSRTIFASSTNGLIGETSLYMFFGVQCNLLACEAENKVRASIDAHLDLVFLAGESLFPMMLVPFSTAASLAALFGRRTSGGAGSGWFVS